MNQIHRVICMLLEGWNLFTDEFANRAAGDWIGLRHIGYIPGQEIWIFWIESLVRQIFNNRQLIFKKYVFFQNRKPSSLIVQGLPMVSAHSYTLLHPTNLTVSCIIFANNNFTLIISRWGQFSYIRAEGFKPPESNSNNRNCFTFDLLQKFNILRRYPIKTALAILHQSPNSMLSQQPSTNGYW